MSRNLLIVDDEPILLSNLEYTLGQIATKIFLAQSGKAALEIIAKESIQCIVCDINMPGMNGVEVLKTLRAQNINTPFIFYTGHGSKELMLEAAQYGAFDFLNKPGLDGIEEVVERGLNFGSESTIERISKNNQFISEYTQMLVEIEQKKT